MVPTPDITTCGAAPDLLARLDEALAAAPLSSRPFGPDALLIWADREDRLATTLEAADLFRGEIAEDCRALATALRNRVARAAAPRLMPMQPMNIAEARDHLRHEPQGRAIALRERRS
jgi:hypothetical protein